MRRAHDRSSESQVGEQAGATGAGPGTTAGAAATGAHAAGPEPETPYTTSTDPYESQHARGTQPAERYGRAGREPAGGYDYGPTSLQSTSTTQGGLFLMLAGLLTFLVGLAFVVRHSFYHSSGLYAYNWTIVSWGWVLFGLGIATFAVGCSHLLHIPYSRPVGITLAVATAVAGFMIVPFYPIWGIIIVALGLAALWGLAHGAERYEQERREYERERQMM